MRLLHTSDWHLGRTLYSKKDRQEEQAAFLNWLLIAIKANAVDLLIVAGDIFDTNTPSNSSQKMYYDFLLRVRDTGCQNVVIVGGNHDSPGFLNAPKEILAAINVCVIGNASENPADEVIVVKDKEDNPSAIVCAVPFLRERDVSRFTDGESYSDRSKRIAENIRKHYEKVAEIAVNSKRGFQANEEMTIEGCGRDVRVPSEGTPNKKTKSNPAPKEVITRSLFFETEIPETIRDVDNQLIPPQTPVTKRPKIPVIATGHLSVAGGKKVEDDGVRDIYIGNIECVGNEIFSPVFDYVALGHYHIASVIDRNVRYSGSPIPMGFGEANKKKSVFIVDFARRYPRNYND